MSKTVLEQALEHLLNKEEDKASALLHDYYVGIGRKVYEDIMADDINLDDEENLEDVTDAIDEVDADLTEEGDDEEMAADDEMAATDDLGADMSAEPESEPASADAADVADAMVDVESALAKLKAEFEEMLAGEEGAGEEMPSEEMPADEMGAEEEMPKESIEEAMELEKVAAPANAEGHAAGAGTGDNSVKGETNTKSAVAGRNPMMARPATKFGSGPAGEGVASGTAPAKAPSSQDQGYTTRPSMGKAPKPGTSPGREGGASASTLPKA